MRERGEMKTLSRVPDHLPIRSSPYRRRRIRHALILLICALAAAAVLAPTAGATTTPLADTHPTWVWPGDVATVVREYVPPPHDYGPGHRGVDVAVATNDIVAPDDGVVAFRGTVVDRPLITIDHGGGLVSTLEPVESQLSVGDTVTRGQLIGTLAAGGHAPAGAAHLGARIDGEYVNPLALLGAAERPVLLPCCAPLS